MARLSVRSATGVLWRRATTHTERNAPTFGRVVDPAVEDAALRAIRARQSDDRVTVR
jgi:hypothetical protein